MKVESNDNDLLDQVKNGLGLRNETELANRLDMSTSALYKIRTGKNSLSVKQRLVIADKIGALNVGSVLKSISPGFLSNKIQQIAVKSARNIASTNEKHIKSDDSELALILMEISEREKNPSIFNALKLTKSEIKKAKEDKLKLTSAKRIELISNLGFLDEERWKFPQTELKEYANSSKALTSKMLSLSLTSKGSVDSEQIDILNAFKNIRMCENDSELASILELTPQQVSHARKGLYKLSPMALLKMAYEIDKIYKDENPLDYQAVLEMVSSTESMLEKLADIQTLI